jgi:sarcosine oxidase, subunit gamma
MASRIALRRAPEVLESAAVRALPPATRYILRGDATVRSRAQAALAVDVPVGPCRAAIKGEDAALWLGPDEWLLIVPEVAAQALSGALAELPHSLVDVSHRQAALLVHGAQAEALLAAGCPLDLDAHAFPVGMCTRTMLAKAEVILWRTEAQAFRLEVWRSFVAYVGQFLAEAARGV